MATTTISVLLMIAAILLWLVNLDDHINNKIKKALSFTVTIIVIILFSLFLK